MERERTTLDDGAIRTSSQALGSVARDFLDHATMIVRDEVKIARLSARRYVEHVRRDLALRAAYVVAAAGLGVLAAVFGLVALFLGIAHAIGSVAWAFAIYAALFAVVAVIAGAMSKRPVARDEGEEIARRFPAARAREDVPQHLLVFQRTSPEAHQKEVEEARREAGLPP